MSLEVLRRAISEEIVIDDPYRSFEKRYEKLIMSSFFTEARSIAYGSLYPALIALLTSRPDLCNAMTIRVIVGQRCSGKDEIQNIMRVRYPICYRRPLICDTMSNIVQIHVNRVNGEPVDKRLDSNRFTKTMEDLAVSEPDRYIIDMLYKNLQIAIENEHSTDICFSGGRYPIDILRPIEIALRFSISLKFYLIEAERKVRLSRSTSRGITLEEAVRTIDLAPEELILAETIRTLNEHNCFFRAAFDNSDDDKARAVQIACAIMQS